MRADVFAEFGAGGVMRVVEVAEPRARAGEVRIAVRASGLSAGEVLLRSGKLGDE